MGKERFTNFVPRHDWLVCIDSDGCVFDTMEIKHKECFCPAMIKHWGLQPIAKYARKAWEFENLYSQDRGLSRFITLYRSIELLKDWEEVKAYGFDFPDTKALYNWLIETDSGNHEALEKSDDPVLKRTLAWSEEVNERIRDMVFGIPPFPYAREAIISLSKKADIVVVSATAREALEKEWEENDLSAYAALICSQDEGTKKECIRMAGKDYQPEKVLMIGDAPGDMQAAHANGVLFYPIRPGDEVNSWREFYKKDMELFFAGAYQGRPEAALIEQFKKGLAVLPPWKNENENTEKGCKR